MGRHTWKISVSSQFPSDAEDAATGPQQRATPA